MRYKTYRGSQSAHCCFEATVVDTTKPVIIGGEHYKDHGDNGQYHYESVCECFEMEDAEKVCAALNAMEPANGEVIDAFRAGMAAERERIKAALIGMDEAAAERHNYYAHAAWVLFERTNA